jgi:hypothetical protein
MGDHRESAEHEIAEHEIAWSAIEQRLGELSNLIRPAARLAGTP